MREATYALHFPKLQSNTDIRRYDRPLLHFLAISLRLPGIGHCLGKVAFLAFEQPDDDAVCCAAHGFLVGRAFAATPAPCAHYRNFSRLPSRGHEFYEYYAAIGHYSLIYMVVVHHHADGLPSHNARRISAFAPEAAPHAQPLPQS